MKKIIVLTDFSNGAEAALGVGDQLATQLGAQLVLIHIYYSFDHYNSGTSLDLERQLLSISKNNLTNMAKQSWITNNVTPVHLMNMTFDDMLKEQEITSNDIIVMGKHGSGRLERFFLGSSTARMLQSVHCPLMIVPDDCSKFDPRTILFASNFYLESDQLLKEAMSLSEKLGGKLHLLKIITAQNFENTSFSQQLIERAVPDSIDPIESIIIRNHDSLVSGILEYSKEIDADLIIVGAHIKSSLKAFFSKTTAEELAKASDIPILTMGFEPNT